MAIAPCELEGIVPDRRSILQFVATGCCSVGFWWNIRPEEYCLTFAAGTRTCVAKHLNGNRAFMPIIPQEKKLVPTGLFYAYGFQGTNQPVCRSDGSPLIARVSSLGRNDNHDLMVKSLFYLELVIWLWEAFLSPC